MPQASVGLTIYSNTQVGADVIKTGNILDGEIINADISASAAIAGSKVQALSVGANAGVIPSTGIVNAHLSGSAGITDANLAQITTAGKVSGAAITLLTSLPAGAGVIPTANLPAPTNASTQGIGSGPVGTGTSTKTQTITHGLGRTPNQIRLFCGSPGISTTSGPSNGIYGASGNFMVLEETSSVTSSNVNCGQIVVTDNAKAVINNVGATTFDIVWTLDTFGRDYSTGKYMWEAQ